MKYLQNILPVIVVDAIIRETQLPRNHNKLLILILKYNTQGIKFIVKRNKQQIAGFTIEITLFYFLLDL